MAENVFYTIFPSKKTLRKLAKGQTSRAAISYTFGMKKYAIIMFAIMFGTLMLYGCASEKKHTVSFDARGGSSVTAVLVKDGHSIESPLSEREGYKLVGWSDGTKIVSFPYTPTADITLEALWQAVMVTVSFEPNGGGEVLPVTVTYGQEVTLPEPSRRDFYFDGWFNESLTTEFNSVAVADITLYAKWSEYAFTINQDDTATITGGTVTGSIKVPSSVTQNGQDYKVTSIADKAFDSGTLTRVKLPDTIAVVNSRAFSENKSLKAIDLSSTSSVGDGAFYGCNQLTEITGANIDFTDGILTVADKVVFAANTAKSSVTTTAEQIASYAFAYSPVTSVSAPNAVSVGERAFYMCASLESADLPTAVTVGEGAFNSCAKLVEVAIAAATEIGVNAFFGCTSLESANVGSAPIAARMFYGCSNLSYVQSKAVSVGAYAFSGCAFTTFTAWTELDFIGEGAFYECANLREVSISATVVGSYAFAKCSSLTSFKFEGLQSLGEFAFSGCKALALFEGGGGGQYYSADGNLYGIDGRLVKCPPARAEGAIVLPDTCSYIGNRAFEDCTITAVYANVTDVGDNAFFNCNQLTSVRLGERLLRLGDNVFANCSALKSIALECNLPPITGTNKFTSNSLVVTVPDPTLYANTIFAEFIAQ